MTKSVTVALVGLGGYGNAYLELFFGNDKFKGVEFIAGIDPDPIKCNYLEEMKNAHIPVFSNLEEFYKVTSADLVIVSTPIHLHESMTCQTLANGSNVLCEKPLTATIKEAESILNAAKQSDNKQVAVGYQWSYSPSVIRLKKDILSGKFGKAKRLKTISLAPRMASYYDRAPWAGRINLGEQWVMDSPVSNATAHYLHNMLYLLGEEEHLSAVPKTVTAETYRAKEIENFDTAMLRCMTENNEEILFYTTHSTKIQMGPMIHFEFEDATIFYTAGTDDNFIARFNDGTMTNYGNPNEFPEATKLALTVDAIRNHTKFRCGIEAASAHVAVVNTMQKSENDIDRFPDDLIVNSVEKSDSLVYVSGLEEAMLQCYAEGVLPSEHGGIRWAVTPETKTVVRNSCSVASSEKVCSHEKY